MCCNTCPFALTEESEYVQNLGCLPTPFDIVQMKIKSGHNWGCHFNEEKICSGFSEYIKETKPELDVNSGGLISYKKWYSYGEKYALKDVDTK